MAKKLAKTAVKSAATKSAHATAKKPVSIPADRFLIQPDPHDPRLTEGVTGIDQTGQPVETRVTVERALTIFLNSQEIVTAMTIGDYPDYLAIGYLLNQNMLKPDEKEILEDLLVTAHADARKKSESVMAEKMKDLTGGLPLPPGLKLPFG